MRTYHFVKYNENTSLDNLIAQTGSETTLCFDFEDSIQDCLDPINTNTLKTNYRNYFKTIINKSKLHNDKLNIGIRINGNDSPEQLLDILVLAETKHVSTIFIPKVSNSNQILTLRKELQKNGVSYNEIIPVIETKNGLNNLDEIFKTKLTKIGGIAFGHCDYNLDNLNFPFFHQDSREYWTWISKIVEFTNSNNLCFVNSPFLQLDNVEFFKNMLTVLYSIGGNNVGQITLTKEQTKICNSFSDNKKNIVLPKILNRLDLKVPTLFAENFIKSFEKNANNKGFAINNERTILSPQEYISSLNFQRKIDFPEINFTFVGGCFPVQGNLPFEKLFHQLLKHKTENIREIKFNVNIIRYERFRNCITKIASYRENNPIDILTFSIRPEPFLRMVKLYYKFLDNTTGKKKWALNLGLFNKVNPEKHDILSLDARFNPTVFSDSSIVRKKLIDLNYILGSILGNDYYSLRKYLDLINEVIDLCRSNNIKLIILGPPIRENTLVEKYLSKKLDSFMRKSLSISKENFVSGSDLYKNGDRLFKENGIYANENYHELIAERLLEKIMPTVDKIAAPNSTLAIGGVSSPLDSFEVAESSVLRTNFCAKKPAHRQSAKRYQQVMAYNHTN
jgi:citrate lyase beta subunit